MLPFDAVKARNAALYGQAYSVTGRKKSDAVTVLAANGSHEPLHEEKRAAPDGDGEVSENPPSGVFAFFCRRGQKKVSPKGAPTTVGEIPAVSRRRNPAPRRARNSPHGKGKNQIFIT